MEILVVDDDDDLREVLSELLRDEGYTVATARHGVDALEWLRKNGVPALILLDLMMPVMDGMSFRVEQRKDPRIAEVPVFVLTAMGAAETRADRLGPVRVFRKPLPFPEFLSAVGDVVHTARKSAKP